MDNIRKRVGEKIREERKKLGLSQDDLAEKAKLHPTYVGGIERGERNPTISSLELIANALNLPLFKLLKIESSNNRDNEDQIVISDLADLYSSQNSETKLMIKKIIRVLLED